MHLCGLKQDDGGIMIEVDDWRAEPPPSQMPCRREERSFPPAFLGALIAAIVHIAIIPILGWALPSKVPLVQPARGGSEIDSLTIIALDTHPRTSETVLDGVPPVRLAPPDMPRLIPPPPLAST